jgi:hypothetical protein
MILQFWTQVLVQDLVGNVAKITRYQAQNVKTGPDALDTVKNGSGSAKHENGTQRPHFVRKWIRERKTRKRQKLVRERKT